MHRQIYEPFPGQKLDADEQSRMREQEMAEFARAFGIQPPTE